MAVLSLSSLLLLAGPTLASDMASWIGLAGIQIQSKIVLTGGLLTWGDFDNASSSYTNAVMDPASTTGNLYEINLNHSINIAQDNISDYLTAGPAMNTDGTPGYVYGGIFNNYYEWFTFGGVASKQVDNPAISTITRGIEFSQGAGYFKESVLNNQPRDPPVSDYIAAGSYVSSPDQGLGWWYGGLVSGNDSVPIEYSPASDTRKASQPSRLFIQATMAMDGSNTADWKYLSVPDWLSFRAESALTWLPYGKSGVLVLMGGVTSPVDILSDAPIDQNNTYMTELVIYDIDANLWYNQSTLEKTQQPPQMAAFCTATVQTADKQGHEIFVYGGYDGTYATANAYDDVWVLSIPAFQWTRVYEGSIAHARQGSVCIAPNPSTMISIGGSGIYGNGFSSPYGVDIFDLNKLSWTGMYNASANDTFNVPDAVVKQIGGSYSTSGPGNNAQISGLGNNVATLFSTQYQKEDRTYYPYNTTTTTNPTNSSSPSTGSNPAPGSKSNHTALIAALATVIPVVIIVAIIAFCCVRRRRKNKEGVERTQRSRGNVFSWLGKSSPIDPAPEKSHTSDETAVNSNSEYTHDKQVNCEVYEAPSNPPTPGWGNQASPRVLSGSMATSPFMGSAEVDAQSRHEIMDHVPREGQSLRQHHMYPRSLSGDQVMSVRSDSISHASTSVMPSRHYGYVSPYELPHDRSHEDLAAPPADVNLGAPRTEANPNTSTHSLGLGAEHVHSPVALIPVAPISRKPVNNTEDDRPRHQRNQSSMSSDLPNLPSPGPEEDRRRSRLIETLPDPKSAQNSPVQPQTAKRSVYTENLDS